jgi:hypothetical protein
MGVSTGSLCQPATWQNGQNIEVEGNSIRKSGGTSSWSDSGASTSQIVSTGSSQNGYVEVVADRTDHYKMFGLSNGDTNQDYSEIDYALEMAGNGTLKIHESGNAVAGSFGSYTAGDVQPNLVLLIMFLKSSSMGYPRFHGVPIYELHVALRKTLQNLTTIGIIMHHYHPLKATIYRALATVV